MHYDLVIYDHPFVGDASSKGWLLDLNAFLTPSRRRTSLRTRSARRGGPTPMTAASGGCPSIPRRRQRPGVPTCSSSMASPCRNRSTIFRRSPGRAAAHRTLDRLAVGADRPHVHADVDRGEHRPEARATPTATFCRPAMPKPSSGISRRWPSWRIPNRGNGTRSAASTTWRRTTTSPTCPTSSTT